ncbi:hypothetical protein DU508_04465 [Pedobacter chinensis]|uniref:DUF1579 domain-containing protein n=1 Tax=Pedobacter chinensis TaxID=2282421 RepID=A0A369Q121_9SPHI|nr:hypothetical protein [Pedobacter chinensis]RDC58202.1 hypothetical protein DU508_04465 [Pedobacter chinensis]
MKNPKLNLLAPYIGTWNTEGKIVNGTEIIGTDVYEWLDGEFFLSHKVDISLNNKKIKLLEIIYYDDLEDVFRSQSFDNNGNISISTIKIIDDIILIFSDDERFQGRFKSNSIEGSWEKHDGENWLPWMDIKLARKV